MLKIDSSISDDSLTNLIINTISSAVFIIDKYYNVVEYNTAFLEIFGSANNNPLHKLCNIDPLYNHESLEFNIKDYLTDDEIENFCHNCSIKKTIDSTIVDGVVVDKRVLERVFYTNGVRENKYFLFTSKPIIISDVVYALVIIDDITDIQRTKTELVDKNVKISEYNRIFREEMELAKKLQRSIVPLKMLEHKGYVILSRYFPLIEVGGDMYDYFVIDDDKIGILICDVVGHGVAASLVTTMVKAISESSKDLRPSPVDFVKSLNSSIMGIAEGYYLSLIYGVIDTSTSEFRFVRAGHPKPVLVDSENGVTEVGVKNNLMVGIIDGFEFEEDVINIKEKQKLMIYTDGLMDTGSSNAGYSKDVFDVLVSKSDKSAKVLIDEVEVNVKKRMLWDIRKDDVCILMVGRN